MRLIDADALYDKAETWYKGAPTPYRQIYRSIVDIIADAPTIKPQPNDPLTLAELREMDGEPVWIAQEGDFGRWAIIAGMSINCSTHMGAERLKQGIAGSDGAPTAASRRIKHDRLCGNNRNYPKMA